MWEVEQCREQLPRRSGGDPENTRSPGWKSGFGWNPSVATLPGPAANRPVRLKERTQHVHETGCSPTGSGAVFFNPRAGIGPELGWSEGWQERIQARVTPSREISHHLREKLPEKLRIHLLNKLDFWKKSFNAAYTQAPRICQPLEC